MTGKKGETGESWRQHCEAMAMGRKVGALLVGVVVGLAAKIAAVFFSGVHVSALVTGLISL